MQEPLPLPHLVKRPLQQVRRKRQAEKAFDFFTKMLLNRKRFRLSELQRTSGYTIGTVEMYVSKKWYWFLSSHEFAFYQVTDQFRGYTLEQFEDDLRQKKKLKPSKELDVQPKHEVQQVVVAAYTSRLFVLLLAIMWWYRVSRRYRVRIWRISLPL